MGSITRFLLLLSVAFCLPLVAYGQTTNEIDQNALYVDQDHPNASDENDGRYQEMGGTGPFKTIQTLVDALKPGMTGYVRESTKPYFQDFRASGAIAGGITFTRGGSTDERITIAGFPGERPIIDQQLKVSTDASKALTAFYIHAGNYITIQNFELTKTRSTAILTNPNPDPGEHVVGLVVDDVHIHSVYGGDNVGGIRIDKCEYCVVRNSTIHDIYNTRETENSQTSAPYGLHAGIHGYAPRNSIIEKNTIYNVLRGVYQKQPNEHGDRSNIVRQNMFYNVGIAYAIEVAGYKSPNVQSAEFYGNIVVNSNTALRAILHETLSQSKSLKIFNNTLYNTGTLSYIRGIVDVEVFNNLVVRSDDYPIYSERTGADELGNETLYSLIDHNVYYDVQNIALLDRSGSYFYFKDLDAWRTAFSISSAYSLSEDPGANSAIVNPYFKDAESYDFRTTNSSISNLGIGGEYSKGVGAYSIFSNIGDTAILNTIPAAPNPPTLSIQ